MIHCGKNTVQENEIYSESNVIGILENRTANRRLVLNRVEQGKMFAPLIMAALDLQIVVCRKIYSPLVIKWCIELNNLLRYFEWCIELNNLLRYFEENNFKRDNSTVFNTISGNLYLHRTKL